MAEDEDELGHLHVGYGAVLRGKPSLQILSDRAALPEEAGEAGDHRPTSPTAHQSDSAGTLLAIGPGVTAPIGLPFNRVVINR
ncbi:hypothetical protein DEJ12_03240 [Curtobacterium sp. MCLR17_059]|nr:hypothetical protein DEJ12_03240 [Curtobacterium sp. MCLR17_059]PZF47559.1 hypothetical protein DEJ10_15030 [Curtobacterium sp. MCLR17_057]